MAIPSLSPEYEARFDALLQEIGSVPRLSSRKLCAFWPMRGSQYEPGNGFLLVGRAVNGWDPEFEGRGASDPESRKGIVQEARKAGESGMRWVTDFAGPQVPSAQNPYAYNTNRSPYWRVARSVVDQLSLAPEGKSWAEFICWTNLFKVSPAKTGNPTGRLYDVQLQGSAELLQRELEEWKPKYVLVVAGAGWWAPFEERMPLRMTSQSARYVDGFADFGGARWVVTCRPEGKVEAEFVEEVVAAFKA